MKTSLTLRPRRPLTRGEAWGCLSANALVAPGLGSLFAGRRSGWLQFLVALTGLMFFVAAVAIYVGKYFRTGHHPGFGGRIGMSGLTGLMLFGFAWVWGMVTGISIVLESGRNPPPSVPPKIG